MECPVAIVVLDFNKKGDRRLQFSEKLAFPALSEVCRKVIDPRMKESVNDCTIRSTEESHAKEQQRRIARKESDRRELPDVKNAKLPLHRDCT
jgi:hypothetical protein